MCKSSKSITCLQAEPMREYVISPSCPSLFFWPFSKETWKPLPVRVRAHRFHLIKQNWLIPGVETHFPQNMASFTGMSHVPRSWLKVDVPGSCVRLPVKRSFCKRQDICSAHESLRLSTSSAGSSIFSSATETFNLNLLICWPGRETMRGGRLAPPPYCWYYYLFWLHLITLIATLEEALVFQLTVDKPFLFYQHSVNSSRCLLLRVSSNVKRHKIGFLQSIFKSPIGWIHHVILSPEVVLLPLRTRKTQTLRPSDRWAWSMGITSGFFLTLK